MCFSFVYFFFHNFNGNNNNNKKNTNQFNQKINHEEEIHKNTKNKL